jgi:hypothetical protein
MRKQCAVAVGGFDTSLEAALDWDFCLRVAARWPFALAPRYQILYRISETAMSANALRIERSCLTLCERAFGRTPAVALRERAESLSNVQQYVAFLYLSRTTGVDFRKEAGRKLAESIRLHPRTLLSSKTWHLLSTWLLLGALPPRLRRPAVMRLLRIYGRWSSLWSQDVRRLLETLDARGPAWQA